MEPYNNQQFTESVMNGSWKVPPFVPPWLCSSKTAHTGFHPPKSKSQAAFARLVQMWVDNHALERRQVFLPLPPFSKPL
jgi:hypothetical protein